ncbi:hypothetical protein [Hansschlegelia zhihuaiae]|uniref:Uncharacterized protein n=1 Tax=Hansschlegelia zhihuaiae TaxID=405005 RepID=A0A4Q0MN61_9HYPH|nr:hypothetical protein [Hansschlegelia zhihuaiae]RXF75053.1 hypothetical protein EK403_03120 [Hansschlegelia zhihuaiae]
MTASRKRSRKAKPAVALMPGDLVLIGTFGVSLPGDWFLAKVEWTDGVDVLVEQYGLSGADRFHHLHSVEAVRAVGDHDFLREAKERARVEVKELQEEVSRAESALGAARAAVWRRLDEIGVAGIQRSGSGGEVDPA